MDALRSSCYLSGVSKQHQCANYSAIAFTGLTRCGKQVLRADEPEDHGRSNTLGR